MRSADRRAFLTGAALALVTLAACTDEPTPTEPQAPPRIAPPAAHASYTVFSAGIPTGRTVVVFKDTASIPQAGLDLIASLGGLVTSRFDDIGVAFVANLSPASLLRLSSSDLVAGVGGDRLINWLPSYHIGGTRQRTDLGVVDIDHPENAPWYKDNTQWNMRVIRADKAWAAGYRGSPFVRVAIIDTGIDYDHRELRGRVETSLSKSFAVTFVDQNGVYQEIGPEQPQPGDYPFMDNHFHGTHVASTIATNNISIASIAPQVRLIAVKVLNALGSGTFESVISGISYAASLRVDAINMSLGAEVEPSDDGVPALLEAVSRAIKDAEKKNVVVVSAAGNSSLDLDIGTVVSTPCEQSTLCVSATGPIGYDPAADPSTWPNFDQPATYTNFGITAIDVAAPGGNVGRTEEEQAKETNDDLVLGACSRRASDQTLVICRANTDTQVGTPAGTVTAPYFYAYAAGTSMATPHVTGVVAMVRSAYRGLSVRGVVDRVEKTADDIHLRGRDVYSNWGRVNVWRAIGGR